MSEAAKGRVTFGVQAGDKEAHTAARPVFMRLRLLLREKCNGDYGEELKELAFVLRVDGEIDHWEKTGCDNLRVTKKGDATIDIFMPIEAWQRKSYEDIRDFLAAHARDGFAQMLKGLLKKGFAFESAKLVADFELAMLRFESTTEADGWRGP